MEARRKSIIRRWETQVGIGVAVACFSVMGVFIGLKVGGGEKADAPASASQAKDVQHSQGAADVESALRAEKASGVELVVWDERRPLGIPDLGEPGAEMLDPQLELFREQGGYVETEGGLAQLHAPAGETAGGVSETENLSSPHPFVGALPGALPEKSPAIELSSKDVTAAAGAMVAAAEKAAVAYPRVHTVKSSDTLMGIAKEHYGDVSKWTLIFDANGLSDKDVLFVGQKLTVPSPDHKVKQQAVVKKASLSRGGSPGAAHRVQSGDTLQKLAKIYYNDESKWKMIQNANKGSLSGRETLNPGEILVIP